MDDPRLLNDYVRLRSDDAFAQLVGRYVGLVYSAARRQVRGDAHASRSRTNAAISA